MAGKKRFTFFKVLLLLVAAVLAWVLLSLRSLQELLQAYQERNREREQVEMLEERIRLLERQRKSLEFSGVEMERQLREYYGMVRPGEKVIYLASEQETSATVRNFIGELETTSPASARNVETEPEPPSESSDSNSAQKSSASTKVKKSTKRK
ncbi:MAG: hypothetical protein D6691_09380 [Candidatus Hydrogenedentota bacterium]|jgi:cell division protein FtsB|uniref:Cell division protein DivIC (FtsB), stabilizes FtsL against RasP cleavage n=1 Tax=Sumerlaea chitinivorans TaxID=2250252 RepID=A0A2Z4YA37_SUMC1|nr:hypothetical protein BRCON_2730 [Candidatus Sumerlaea chitinivorans]RMH25580.1 MAG: hypothetical protein D6691_09380 [Candidatus Hydrogenedentota bacterium]